MSVVVGVGASGDFDVADAIQSLVVNVGTSFDDVMVGEIPYFFKSRGQEWGIFRQFSGTGKSVCFYLSRAKRVKGCRTIDESCKYMLLRQNSVTENPVARLDCDIHDGVSCLSVELIDNEDIVTNFFDFFLKSRGFTRRRSMFKKVGVMA